MLNMANIAVIVAYIAISVTVVTVIAILLYCILRSPFSYPYFIYEFDVSGKRSPQIDDLLDKFLISGGFEQIQNHRRVIDQWKQESCQRIEHSILKKYRERQYTRTLDDSKAFVFYFVRSQTR